MAGTLVVGEIQTQSNGDLTLNPNGTGDVVVDDTNIATTSNKDINLAPHGTGVVEIHGNEEGGADNTGAIKLNCEQNSHGVTIKSPTHSNAASYTLTLPVNDGSANDCLVSDGNGVLSWSARATTSGASVSAENTWTAGQRGEITTVASGTTITIDFDASNNFQVALGHNVSTIAISNPTVGQSGSIFFAQPTSGSTTHTVQGWNGAFKFPGAAAPTMSTAINKVDRVDYVIRATDQIHVVATLDMAV